MYIMYVFRELDSGYASQADFMGTFGGSLHSKSLEARISCSAYEIIFSGVEVSKRLHVHGAYVWHTHWFEHMHLHVIPEYTGEPISTCGIQKLQTFKIY